MINFSEILWKPQSTPRVRSSTPVPQAAEIAEELTELRQLPTEEVRILPESRIVVATNPRSPGADRFRLLRTRLRELKEVVTLQKLLITSPLPQDGKSTVILNLATVLAEHGKRSVLVLEADLYKPSLAQRLGLEVRHGLAECLEGGVDPMTALRRLEPLGWYLLPAGSARGNPTELLQSESVASVMRRLSPHFDWILIDTPPVAPLADAISLLRYVDAAMLVVRADQTPQEAVKHALETIGQKHVLGVIFNAAEGLNQSYSAYYSHYGKE